MNSTARTDFAPAERATASCIKRQSRAVLDSALFKTLCDSISEFVMVLNQERQIIFCNQNLLDFLGLDCAESIYGLRPGEALNCAHASEAHEGCGTTRFCRTCGAVNAILTSRYGKTTIRECRLNQKDPGGNAFDFLVRATPLSLGNYQFTIFAVTDISHKKRRIALERIFFHDILNTAASLLRLSEIATMASPDQLENLIRTLHMGTARLIDEIQGQRELIIAENNKLVFRPASIDSLCLLQELADVYRNHEIAKDKTLHIEKNAPKIVFTSDRSTLTRVLENMLKNALEASRPGEVVTVGCRKSGNWIDFYIHNPAEMPPDVQLEIFKRSYSTKGQGRGLGTYSMKLLSERCLGGRVSFTSSAGEGTTFTACYPVSFPGTDWETV